MTIFFALAAIVVCIVLAFRLKAAHAERAAVLTERDTARAERDDARGEHERLVERFRGVVDADAERARILALAAQAQAESRAAIERERNEWNALLESLRQQLGKRRDEESDLVTRIGALRADFEALDEESNLQSFGLYKPRYDFADSARYEAELDRIRAQQKAMLKEKLAAVCKIEWTVNGSKVEGRKSTNQTIKLMLRAFNGECDAAIAKVRYNNVHVMEARIDKAFEMINGMAQVQQCSISGDYLLLKLDELHLVHEYEEKVQEEKEEQRRIREQMREEEIAQRELEKAKAEAEKEELQYERALSKARDEAERAVGDKQQKLMAQIEELQRRVAEAQSNKERAIARAQMTRSGHVYVISNIGSFGEHVYKIGMTRRLDPMDRIRELGDASVPFSFDVHAVIYSDDAPALENTLHRAFHHRRVNRINERKEFFRVTIDDLAAAVQKHHGEIEVTRMAEAKEYRKTQAIVEEEQRTHTPSLLSGVVHGATAGAAASVVT